jgi:hypothetical protein
MKTVSMFLAFLFATIGTAFALGWEPIIPTFADAPAHLTRCFANHFDYHVVFRANFINDGPATLKAVKLRFDFQDAFGTVVRTLEGNVAGSYSSGAEIKDLAVWEIGDQHFGSSADISKVTCYVEKTLNDVGRVWINAHLPPAGPGQIN